MVQVWSMRAFSGCSGQVARAVQFDSLNLEKAPIDHWAPIATQGSLFPPPLSTRIDPNRCTGVAALPCEDQFHSHGAGPGFCFFKLLLASEQERIEVDASSKDWVIQEPCAHPTRRRRVRAEKGEWEYAPTRNLRLYARREFRCRVQTAERLDLGGVRPAVLVRVDARIQPKDTYTIIRAEEVGDERTEGTERQITQNPTGSVGRKFLSSCLSQESERLESVKSDEFRVRFRQIPQETVVEVGYPWPLHQLWTQIFKFDARVRPRPQPSAGWIMVMDYGYWCRTGGRVCVPAVRGLRGSLKIQTLELPNSGKELHCTGTRTALNSTGTWTEERGEEGKNEGKKGRTRRRDEFQE
ncbi:hypothetical protein B0H13DRAFT_2459748 [Mycena leptocephala]|nr:hypothetical protein B0H13DRAFT_2459748 [Mycena leptocephala]